jgi:hypothetical protein
MGSGMSRYDQGDRDQIANAIYKALKQYDEAKRMARGLRIARNGKGPTIKRGTGRSAQTIHVLTAVIEALDQLCNHKWGAAYTDVEHHADEGGYVDLPGGQSIAVGLGRSLMVPIPTPGVFVCSKCGATRP